MPLPNITAAPETAEAGRLLFISYSHVDMENYAARFVTHLKLKLEGMRDQGYSPDDIFFDRNALRAGQVWAEHIQTALERAEALIFLVSPDSLSSGFCRNQELAPAVQRGILIIPVVLCDCPWDGVALPGDANDRKLGDIGALPKSASFQLVPVSHWPDRDQAWKTVVDQIAEALREPPAAPATRRPRTALPPLLPYYCNQQPLEMGFNKGMMGWSATALLVLVKGTLDDRAPRFWDRLRLKNLGDFATARRQEPVLEQRVLHWPSAWDGARVRKGLDGDMLYALSDALIGNGFGIGTAAALANQLQTLDGVLPLLATLPDEPPKALTAAFRALFQMFEDCPPQARLDRLVIAFVIEDADLVAQAQVVRRLRLGAHPRAQVVELDALRELDQDEVRIWYRAQDLEKLVDIDEPRLVAEVFKDTHALRFAQFEARLKPLIGL